MTEKCVSRCAHCQGWHSPERTEAMEVEDGLRYLEEISSVAKLESFMIFGGEPMLYPERAVRFFQKAGRLGIPSIQLITNGFWGRQRVKAGIWARKLKEAGVNEVLVSVDAFHHPYIPLEWPKKAASACLQAGVDTVKWNVSVLEDINADNRYDQETRQILDSLSGLGIEASFNDVWPRGRAAKNLRRYFTRKPLEDSCPNRGNLVSPAEIGLGPAGRLSICWSMSIGNAKTTSLSDLLEGYDYRKHRVINALVECGPTALLEFPEAQGFQPQRERYLDGCELCIELRRFMKET